MIVNHQSSAPEPVASNTSSQRPVISLLRKYHACGDTESAKLDEAFIVCEDRVLKLKSSLSTTASTEVVPRPQVVTLPTDLSNARSDLTAVRSFANLATTAINTMRTDNK